MRTLSRESEQMITANLPSGTGGNCGIGKDTNTVKRLSNIGREIEATRKPSRGKPLMKSEDEKKGRANNGKGNMNREECGASKRQKSMVRATAKNWGREKN